MRPPVDRDGDLLNQEIGARAPQFVTSTSAPTFQTPSGAPSTITSPLFPEPSNFNMTTPSHDNSVALRTIVEYFFLILALFIASILIFRRIFYRRKRNQPRREPSSNVLRLFPRTTNIRGYPHLDNYLLALPLPAASRRTRANDIDLDGRRFTSVRAEVDHDGFLRDKDVLPKYETLGSPPMYAESDVQQVLEAGTVPPPPLPVAQSPRNGGIMLVETEASPIQPTPSRNDNSRSSATHTLDSDSVPLSRP